MRVALADCLVPADRAENLLRRLLVDSSPPVRSASIRRLTSAERARRALTSDDLGVRGAAARRLGEFGGRSDVDRLRALLHDPESWVRRRALLALPHLVSRLPQRTRSLRRWLADVMLAVAQTDLEPEVRAAAKIAVANLSISA